ncbi:MAG: Rpn family recombination-promoting nuclease/putative transposase [Clostridiales bacterium]|nr:Rpn family recombination-promoting nuclease/putative transposase [Clostridiales bacterium]
MINKEKAVMDFLKKPEVLADAVNFYFCNGEKKIDPKNLVPMSNKVTKNVSNIVVVKRNDIPGFIAVIGVVNQSEVSYRMVELAMKYEGLIYDDQAEEIHKQNLIDEQALNPDTPKDLDIPMSRLKNGQKLLPVITLVVNFGCDKWDGPMRLYDMFVEMPDERLLPYIPDYKLYLINPIDIEDADMDKFQSGLRLVMKASKCLGNPELVKKLLKEDPDFQNVDSDAAAAISALTGLELSGAGDD